MYTFSDVEVNITCWCFNIRQLNAIPYQFSTFDRYIYGLFYSIAQSLLVGLCCETGHQINEKLNNIHVFSRKLVDILSELSIYT